LDPAALQDLKEKLVVFLNGHGLSVHKQGAKQVKNVSGVYKVLHPRGRGGGGVKDYQGMYREKGKKRNGVTGEDKF
jgi:hypothetical protein